MLMWELTCLIFQKYYHQIPPQWSLVAWRAIRRQSKWPFKVECIDRAGVKGANKPANGDSSLVTACVAVDG